MPRRARLKASSSNGGCVLILILVGIAALCSSVFSSGPSSPSFKAPATVPGWTKAPTERVSIASSPTRIPTKKTISLRACANTSANIRQGPGTDYAVIGGVVSGLCVTVVGRNQDGSWANIETDDHLVGWIFASLLDIDGDIKSAALSSYVAAVPTAVPQNPAGSGNDSVENSNGAEQNYPAGATAICKDGTYSYSANRRGTCSHHGGVAQWLP